MPVQSRCTIPYFWPEEESAWSRRIIKRAISQVLISRSQSIPDLRFRSQKDLLEYASMLGIDESMLIEVQAEIEDLDVSWRRRKRKSETPEIAEETSSIDPEPNLDLFS